MKKNIALMLGANLALLSGAAVAEADGGFSVGLYGSSASFTNALDAAAKISTPTSSSSLLSNFQIGAYAGGYYAMDKFVGLVDGAMTFYGAPELGIKDYDGTNAITLKSGTPTGYAFSNYGGALKVGYAFNTGSAAISGIVGVGYKYFAFASPAVVAGGTSATAPDAANEYFEVKTNNTLITLPLGINIRAAASEDFAINVQGTWGYVFSSSTVSNRLLDGTTNTARAAAVTFASATSPATIQYVVDIMGGVSIDLSDGDMFLSTVDAGVYYSYASIADSALVNTDEKFPAFTFSNLGVYVGLGF